LPKQKTLENFLFIVILCRIKTNIKFISLGGDIKMVRFIPVNYRNKKYPPEVIPKIKEVPAHFDSKEPVPNFAYSLHTEYSYMPRRFDLPIVKDLSAIVNAVDNHSIPMLWYSPEWAEEFAEFIFRFVRDEHPPQVIEVHPPFDDNYRSIFTFIEIYKHFEDKILSKYPNVEILIENRFGSQHNGNFLISSSTDLLELSELICKDNLRLRIALDFPQLFSNSHSNIGNFTEAELKSIFSRIQPVHEYIKGIHLWGKCYGKNMRVSAHMGTLDSYFYGIECSKIKDPHSSESMQYATQPNGIKNYFLNLMYNFLDDDNDRYFVPEVNSKSEHLRIIVNDLLDFGFVFV
jgi:hypothetical protein